MSMKCVLEMEELPETQNGIYLPDNSKRRMFFDKGTVIAETDTEFKKGDVVWIDQMYGAMRVYNSYIGNTRIKNQLRFVKKPYYEYIMAKGEDMQATGNNVVIIADDKVDKAGELYLPDSEAHRPGTGVVHSIGERVKEDLSVGDKVIYSVKNCRLADKDGVPYRVLSEDDIYSVYEE